MNKLIEFTETIIIVGMLALTPTETIYGAIGNIDEPIDPCSTLPSWERTVSNRCGTFSIYQLPIMEMGPAGDLAEFGIVIKEHLVHWISKEPIPFVPLTLQMAIYTNHPLTYTNTGLLEVEPHYKAVYTSNDFTLERYSEQCSTDEIVWKLRLELKLRPRFPNGSWMALWYPEICETNWHMVPTMTTNSVAKVFLVCRYDSSWPLCNLRTLIKEMQKNQNGFYKTVPYYIIRSETSVEEQPPPSKLLGPIRTQRIQIDEETEGLYIWWPPQDYRVFQWVYLLRSNNGGPFEVVDEMTTNHYVVPITNDHSFFKLNGRFKEL